MPGIYLAGVIVAGERTNEIFIENGRFHGQLIAADSAGEGSRPSRSCALADHAAQEASMPSHVNSTRKNTSIAENQQRRHVGQRGVSAERKPSLM